MSIPTVNTSCVNGTEYIFTLDSAKSFDEAIQFCSRFDTGDNTTRPAFINSREQMNFLFEFFGNSTDLSELSNSEKEFYIGNDFIIYSYICEFDIFRT